MTSQDQDTERKWAKPVEELAKVILKRRFYDGEEAHYDGLDGFWQDLDPDHWFGAVAEAQDAISVLLRHGWVNPQFMDALKAEKAEASTPGKARNT